MSNKAIYLFLIVIFLAGAFLVYHNNSDKEIKYCDTQNIDRSYGGEILCYEQPAQSLEYIDKNAGKIKPIKMELKK